ncbi:GNAT family N-acetyltransferase [Gramella sp. KN1008]|uniref:GNAT family N-acetyltransferase n=1 Tax=Gramella sp. KN1008 TaxID=2529298 RepID=UPI001039757B|nr:GNAT family protein [Gramella sp. KN1008]TBW28703.1 N-acetyltransferase [Gramella sp. KN1008]
MTNYKKIIETNQIILRPIKEADFEEMRSLTRNEQMWTYFTSNLSNENELLNWIKTAERSVENNERLAFTIIDKRNNKIVGSTSLGNFSERDKRIEIGWTWLSENVQGTGLNQMVKLTLLKYCFEELNLERVECKTDVLNIAARKGLKKSGFTEEGILRSHTLLANGRRRDSIYYGILKNEWNIIQTK